MNIIQPLSNIHEDYNFLMGYTTGRIKPFIGEVGSIFMGAWNDPLLAYKDYAVNEPYVVDGLWSLYNEEVPAPTDKEEYKKYENEGYMQWLQDNIDLLYESLDSIIDAYEEEVKNENIQQVA